MTSKKAIITGIVAEFNPFHNGHKYIIEKARKDTGADYVIVVMSGDFVQRGSAAIMDKHARTMSALKSGVDAVFMLPVAISTASAQYFARGSVKMLADLGCDYLYFGSEDGDIENIEKLQYIPGSVETPNNILAREYMDAIREYTNSSYGKGFIIPNTIYKGAIRHNAEWDKFIDETYKFCFGQDAEITEPEENY